MKSDAFTFSWFQIDSGKSFQLFSGSRNARVRIANVEFRHFRTFSVTGVRNVKRNRNRLLQVSRLRCDRQVAIGKSGIGKAVSKGKQRLRCGSIEVPIPEKYALGILDSRLSFRWIVAVKDRVIFPAALK